MLRLRVVLFLCILAWPPAPAHADDILSPAQAAAKPGASVTMQMRVKSLGSSSGGTTDLLSEASYQHSDAFLVRITPAARDKFRELKIADVGRHFNQQLILVTGKVKLVNYTNIGKRPVIDIDDPKQIEIFDPETHIPPGEEIMKLYQSGKLLQRSSYKEVRAAFARRFEAAHEADLRNAYGQDFDAFTAWLAKNTDTRENFYTALVERWNDIPKALALFKEIWKRHGDALPRWSQLAIATAVTWDRDRAIYDYKQHQLRVQSTLPDGMMDALDNFKYIVDNEKRMPQPVALYPWEFLQFVINHRTPLTERYWAFGFYQTAKVKSKSWHQDVPYDMDLFKRDFEMDASAKPKLLGKEYTLANIKTFGGVCAHQADFACRTAQSLGIPAVYCSGSSAYREHHAWWMYINVVSATKDDLTFTLHSDGRFDGKDNFFTGQVLDPQSGTRMLDRDMERRLWIAGSDRLGKRFSAMLMRLYPAIARTASLTTKEKVAYLEQVLKVSKYNEDAWVEFAHMAKRGELVDENKKIALTQLAALNKTFANYPDFIWRIFDDLVEVTTVAEKGKYYETVLQQFEKAKRADLACDARLKLTEVLAEQAKYAPALKGLTESVGKFPTEGRYVPKLLKKMEEVSVNVKDGPAQVAKAYIDLLPGMIVYYRSDTTVYYKKMRDQAKVFFEQNNLTQAAATLETRIAQAKVIANKK
jgi:hypothetical protein